MKKPKIIDFKEKTKKDIRDYAGFEEWEGDYYYLEKNDYDGLVKYRDAAAQANPKDIYSQIRLGEAYILNNQEISVATANAESLKSNQVGLTEPRELETFLDEIISKRMKEDHIPGVSISVVKDGNIFFAKGYGYADINKKVPVDPAKTVFKIASVSKLVTATAVMQQAERGNLKLNDDVNKYLNRFKIENNFSQPVTVASLLNHTSGFNQMNIGIGTRSKENLMTLEEYFSKGFPPRVNPPGEFFSYSNQGMSLAGYLVEKVTGIPFANYIEQNIFKPVKMEHSSFVQPLSPGPTSSLATGYTFSSNTYNPVPPLFIHTVPSGGMSTSALDMANFMNVHLMGGRYGSVQILKESTAKEMHKQNFTYHPLMPGSAYGFREYYKNNQRILFHTGTEQGFASILFLIPDQNIGFFTSFNRAVSIELRDEIMNEFINHYFPVNKVATPKPPADFKLRSEQFTGLYWHVEKPQHTLDKLEVIMADDGLYSVMATDKGTLLLKNFFGQNKGEYVEIKPLTFKQIDGDGYLVFRGDDKGKITHMFFGLEGTKKIGWYENPLIYLGLAGFSVIVFLVTIVIWVVNYFRHRNGEQSIDTSKKPRVAILLAGLVVVLSLIFLIGVGFVAGRAGYLLFMFGIPASIVVLLAIPIIIVVLAFSLLYFTILAWKNSYWSVLGRIHFSLITIATLSLIGFLKFWNMIGFKY